MPALCVPIEEVKKNIRALLISAPRGLTVDDIEHDYRAMLGKPLPYKDFKCHTSLEFLKTMPDVVSPSWSNGTLILRGIADSSTRHIAKLVSRQKVNNSKSRRVSKPPICTKPLIVPSYFRTNIKELLASYPNGVLGSALNAAYMRHYGEEINHAKLGFKSLSHLLGCMQDIATIVKDWKLDGSFRVCATARKKKFPPPVVKTQQSKTTSRTLPAPQNQARTFGNCVPNRMKTTDLNSLENEVSRKNEKNVEKSVKNILDSKSGVSEGLKEELISILTKRPNGIWAARLPFEYKAMFNKELSVLSLGFYSVIELVSSLPDVIRIERPFPNGDWMLFLAEKSKKEKNITKIHVPENAIGKGILFHKQTLPEADSIGIYVTHIKSPDCFWVQLVDCWPELKELEEKLEVFYNSKESAQFLMDDGLVKLGQVCVARFPTNGMWYRALLAGTPGQNMAEVLYVDYGNSSQVSKSDLRLMKKEFFELPPQAFKSKLANIKPKSKERWDPSSSYRLDELTADKQLYCWVTDRKDDVLSLCICDTTSSVDIHINDLLVEEGFAVFKNCKPLNNNEMIHQQEHNQKTKSAASSQRARPPGLASPSAKQKDEALQNALNAVNPSFPEYPLPLNLFSGLSSYGIVPVASVPPLSPAEQLVPVPPEEKLPVITEEKPSKEDLEFMRQVCEELSENEIMTVKRLDLPDNKCVHLINFQNKPYVVRSEISALLWKTDRLRSMLRQEKMVVPKEVITREDHEELFNELKRLKVGDFDNGDEVKEFASLYGLSEIPGILETFKHPSAETIQRLREEKQAFDASPDTFWTNSNDGADETDDSCQSEPEEEPNLEELKLALQALQFRRKRILRSMMRGEFTSGQNAVDEVDEVEKQLDNIRDLIVKAEAKEKSNESDELKKTENQESEKNASGDVGKDNKDDGVSSAICQNTSNEVNPTPPNVEQSAKPVDVTKPEVSSTSPNSKDPFKISENPTQVRQTDGMQNSDMKNKLLSVGGNPDEVVHNEKHYHNVVEGAQKLSGNIIPASTKSSSSLERPKSSTFISDVNSSIFTHQEFKPREFIPREFKPREFKPREFKPQEFNSAAAVSSVPSFHGIPPGAPAYLGPIPHPNFLHFPPINTTPQNHVPPFPGYIGQLHPILPPFQDMVAPASIPYQPPGVFNQPHVSSIYLPWASNPLGACSLFGEGLHGPPGR